MHEISWLLFVLASLAVIATPEQDMILVMLTCPLWPYQSFGGKSGFAQSGSFDPRTNSINAMHRINLAQ